MASDRADESLPARFERVVKRHASRIAIGTGIWRPTYAELNDAASRLAHGLLRRDGGSGDRIVILMQHEGALVASILAALKADRIAVVLSPANPPARLKQLVEDAEPRLIVTDSDHAALAAQIAGTERNVISFDREIESGRAGDLPVITDRGETAFLVYTSGSSGHPKGVMQTHRQHVCDVANFTEAISYTADDRLALLGSLSHGQGLGVMWCALLNGAALYSFPVALKGITGLSDWITENRITSYVSSASIFRNFMKALDDDITFPFVREVRLTSEPANSDDFRQFQKHFPDTSLFVHTLASSEASYVSISCRTRSDEVPDGWLPTGHVMKGRDVLILDGQGVPVRTGDVGEIVVKSRNMAAGYWRNPSLTAERFSVVPHGDGERLFHTGDMGRIDADGQIEFLGRRDRRVKIRGNRIDLSEVEDALRRLPGIGQAAVEVIEREGHEPLLAGYVVTRDDESWSPVRLRRSLRSTLPDQMVPSTFLVLDAFPLTPGGKLDRERLRHLRPAQNPTEQPRTATERLIAACWSEAFKLPDIGRQDDFFALGGDSLIAAGLAARIHAASGVALEFRAFGDHPTLAELAAIVDERRRHDAPEQVPLVPVARDRPLPLSLFQELAWRLSRTPKGSASQVHAAGFRIVGPLDRSVLRECLNDLAQRHEGLRTTFGEIAGQPVQFVHSPTPVALPFVDLTGAVDAEGQARRLLEEECSRVLDLSQAPLLRWSLVRIREHEHWLLRASHHIIFDAWSSELCLRDLAICYEARLRGQSPPFAAPQPLQYADYAHWQHTIMRRGVAGFDRAIGWWRNALAGAPLVLELPFVRSKPVLGLDPEAGLIRWRLDPDVTQRLERLQAEGSTYYIVRIAGYVALLAAVTGRRDVIVGITVANRQRAELQAMFGYFVNHALLRLQFEPARSFREWLPVVRKCVLDTAAHGDIPHALLRKELLRKGVLMPATDATFTVSRHRFAVDFAGLALEELKLDRHVENYSFNVNFDEHHAEHCAAAFDARWCDPVEVQSFIDSYRRFLAEASRHPDLPMGELLTRSGVRQLEQPGWLRRAGAIGRRLVRRWRHARELDAQSPFAQSISSRQQPVAGSGARSSALTERRW